MVKSGRTKTSVRVTVIFFDGTPNSSYSINIVDGEKIVSRLCHGTNSHDEPLLEKVPIWEQAGFEVVATQYKAGKWTRNKPLKFFKRFKEQM